MKEKIMPFISVIIPVYNVEKQLGRCVESILRQKYTYFELLLVNDGSKDASGSICNAYAQKDNRISVIHKENGGASSARNVGLENANGKYICFVDSDDYVDEEYLSAFFVDALKEDEETLVVQEISRLINNIVFQQQHFYPGLYSDSNFSQLFYLNQFHIVGRGPCCKLYYREIINKHTIRFNDKIHYGEDILFLIDYISHINKIYLMSESHYYYVNNSDSLSKSYNSFESEILCFNTLKISLEILIKTHKLDRKAIESLYEHVLISQNLRAIFAMYRLQTKKKRGDRIRIMKELSVQNEFLSDYKHPKRGFIINKFGYFLYTQKLFSLFDICFSVFFGLRYKFNKQWRIFLIKGHI